MSEYLNEATGEFEETEQYTVPNGDWDFQFSWAEEYWQYETEKHMREVIEEKIEEIESDMEDAADEGRVYTGPTIGLTEKQLDKLDYDELKAKYFEIATNSDNENLITTLGVIVHEYNATVNH